MSRFGTVCPTLLRISLCYDPKTGLLTWRKRPKWMFSRHKDFLTWNTRWSGRPAFTALVEGYKKGRVFGVSMKAHRVAWAVMYGVWPIGGLDHINQNKADNRIENLREASKSENGRNTKIPSDNTSGVMGVSFDKRSQSWRAYINGANGRTELGLFKLKDDAICARRTAERRLGYSRNHGGCDATI